MSPTIRKFGNVLSLSPVARNPEPYTPKARCPNYPTIVKGPGPKGHGSNSGGILQIFPVSQPCPTIPYKNHVVPCRHSGASPSPPSLNRRRKYDKLKGNIYKTNERQRKLCILKVSQTHPPLLHPPPPLPPPPLGPPV